MLLFKPKKGNRLKYVCKFVLSYLLHACTKVQDKNDYLIQCKMPQNCDLETGQKVVNVLMVLFWTKLVISSQCATRLYRSLEFVWQIATNALLINTCLSECARFVCTILSVNIVCFTYALLCDTTHTRPKIHDLIIKCTWKKNPDI